MGLALIFGALLFVRFLRSDDAPSEEVLLAAARRPVPAAPSLPAPSALITSRPRVPPAEASRAAPDEERALWKKRLARAEHTLASYREATRYPPGSRPMTEHPDQGRPHHVAPVTVPLARADRKLTDARVTLDQDRLFLVGDERVTFTLSCVTSEGPAACEIQKAIASVTPDVTDAGALPAAPGEARPIAFSVAEGAGGGVARAVFQPSAQGFAGYHGSIHVELTLVVAGESGGASFEVVYTPRAPAVFTGRVREAIEQGSLALYVEMDVVDPGRYVLAARVDDAEGRSFGYLSFNDELAAGKQEARLVLFGKLLRDEGARAPYRVRDLEGFRLIADAHPDRALMAAIEGAVYTTRSYALREFSAEEWQSEERDRHLKEMTKDVEEAKRRAGE